MAASIRFFAVLVPMLAQYAMALFPRTNETNHIAALNACNQLDVLLGSPLVQSSGPSYETAATNAWNLQNSEYQPTCIVFPTTSDHVQVVRDFGLISSATLITYYSE
ncbi:hypothetical protein B0H12DRAFT_1117340 [Mycena haematopus]|nr:hypothetical protein B0H12DRAFT_1117340 [Mycena haematopus]